MLKKVLCGTMAIGLAALLSLPELSLALPQLSKQTTMTSHQLELAKTRRRSKKSKKGKRGRRAPRQTQFQQTPSQVQQHFRA